MVEQYRCVGTGVPMALVIGYMNLPGEKEKEGQKLSGGCEDEGENGLWTVDTVDTPPFGGAYKIKMASHCVVPSCVCISKQSPLTAHR